MEANQKIMDALKWVSGTGCTIGIIIVSYQFFVSGYNKGYVLSTIGITIMLSAAAFSWLVYYLSWQKK